MHIASIYLLCGKKKGAGGLGNVSSIILTSDTCKLLHFTAAANP